MTENSKVRGRIVRPQQNNPRSPNKYLKVAKVFGFVSDQTRFLSKKQLLDTVFEIFNFIHKFSSKH